MESNPVGRPTIFDDSVMVRAIDYIESCEDVEETKMTGQSDSFTKYETKLKVNIPTIEGLARYLKIHRSTLYAWQKEKPEFSDIIEQLQQKQVERLLNMGLSGDYNSTIAKVLLTKHGYNDKTEIDQKTELSGSVKYSGIEIINPNEPQV
jgi:hypothetical protein